MASAQAVMQYYTSLIQRLKLCYLIRILVYGHTQILVCKNLSAMLKTKFSQNSTKQFSVSPYFRANSLVYQAKSWVCIFKNRI